MRVAPTPTAILQLTLFSLLFNPLTATDSQTSHDTEGWPTFHKDAQRSGFSASAAPRLNRTLWVTNLGAPIWSSPAVQDNRVYVTTIAGTLFALDAQTGDIIWRFEYEEGQTPSSPTVSRSVVYFAAETGRVYAVDSETGKETWPQPFIASPNIYSSPLAHNGLVLVGSACSPQDMSCHFYAIEEHAGRLSWTRDVDNPILASAAASNSLVFVAEGPTLHAFNISNGAPIWSYDVSMLGGSTILSSPLAIEDEVIVSTANGIIVDLDISGSVRARWLFKPNNTDSTAIWFSSPAHAEGHIFIGVNQGSEGYIYSLDAVRGTVDWTHRTNRQIGSSPAIADGMLFIGSMDSSIYALHTSDGTPAWTYETGGGVFSSPAIANNTVFIGSFDGNVYAFAAPDFEIDVQPRISLNTQGENAAFNVTVTSTGGFSQPVFINAQLPSQVGGLTTSSRAVIPPIKGRIQAEVTIPTANLEPGTYSITFSASAGELEKSVFGELTVLSREPGPTQASTSTPTTTIVWTPAAHLATLFENSSWPLALAPILALSVLRASTGKGRREPSRGVKGKVQGLESATGRG